MPEVGTRRAAEAQGGEGADGRHRRPRLAARHVPRRGRGRHHRPGRVRHRRRVEPPPPDPLRPAPTSAGRRSRPRWSGCSDVNPHVEPHPAPDAPRLVERARHRQGLRHRRRRHRQLPDPLPGQRRLRAARASPTSTARSSASKGRSRCSGREKGPCYRCLFPEPPPPGLVPSCAEGGVLGVLPGIIGSLQANEVIKLIIGKGEPADRPAAAVRRAGASSSASSSCARTRSARCAASTRRSPR